MRSVLSGVYVKVQDMDRAQRFYENALGLVLKFRDGAAWCQFEAGDVAFSLSSPEEAAPGASGSTVVFKWTDAGEARAKIESAGGTFEDLRDMGSHGCVMTFTDPDGNVFQVLIPTKTQPEG